jgi:hypothetical protein
LGLELLHFNQTKLYNARPGYSFFGNKKGGLIEERLIDCCPPTQAHVGYFSQATNRLNV